VQREFGDCLTPQTRERGFDLLLVVFVEDLGLNRQKGLFIPFTSPFLKGEAGFCNAGNG